MKQKTLIVLADGFETLEAITPIDILQYSQHICVTTTGLEKASATSGQNVKILTDTIISEIDPSLFNAIILPGGLQGIENCLHNQKLLHLLQEFYQQNKWIAAICAAPLILCKLGILEKHQFTCFPGLPIDNLPKTYINQRVVVDHNIITSQLPGTAADFTFAIIENLVSKQEAKKIHNGTLFQIPKYM